ncbi:MAG: glycosyltransferase family 2 protein [Acidobacteria bacterium]|nr:glycosyltransferase family 2 protein [Acidobacteriota bacterium]
MARLSIVVPVYRNEQTVAPLYQALQRLDVPAVEREYLFVNDASSDASLSRLLQLCRQDPDVGVVNLKTNLGQNRALLVGLFFAGGTHVVTMDADLQDPPDAIPQLMSCLDRGYEAVFAGRRGRYEPWMERCASSCFKALFHWATGTKIPRDAGLYILMSRKMVRSILCCDSPAPYLLELIARTGLPTTSVPVPRAPRKGRSAYTFRRRLAVAVPALGALLASRRRRESDPAHWIRNVDLELYGEKFQHSFSLSGET